MMKIAFYKYHGTGNDFIIIDNRNNIFKNSNQELISFLCNRNLGIGADGLMLLKKSRKYDFEMSYFNSDGKEATMCGNGGRCISAFAKKIEIIKDSAEFIAADGVHKCLIKKTSQYDISVKLLMSNVTGIKKIKKGFFLNTGVPHYVEFVKDVNAIDVEKSGRIIRYDKKYFPEGTNVNFCQIAKNKLIVRTYERGVEAETLSCGTGSVACAISAYFSGNFQDKNHCSIEVRGGCLKVYFNQSDKELYNDIWLEGPAQFVYKGEIEI